MKFEHIFLNLKSCHIRTNGSPCSTTQCLVAPCVVEGVVVGLGVVLGVVPPRNVVWRLGVVFIITQFAIFKPLSYCFEEAIGFDKEHHLQGLQCHLSSNQVT